MRRVWPTTCRGLSSLCAQLGSCHRRSMKTRSDANPNPFVVWLTRFRGGRRPTFAALVVELYGTLDVRAPDGGRGPWFHPCERTAMALYRLGHGAGVRATAALFGVSDGWVSRCTSEFLERVVSKLIPKWLSWPSRNDQDNISAAFEQRTGFRSRRSWQQPAK